MYVKYVGDEIKNILTKNKIYKVLNIIENYYYLIKDDGNIETVFEPNSFKIFALLKVKYIGNSDIFSLIKDKTYDVISIESFFSYNDSYRIIDESEDDYLYHKNSFEIIENNLNEIS